MNNLIKRTLFGALFITIVITSLLFAQPYYFRVVFFVISVLATLEFCKIQKADSLLSAGSMLLSGLLFSLFTLLPLRAGSVQIKWLITVAITYAIMLLLLIIAELFKKAESPLHNWGLLLSSQVMVALPFSLLNILFDRSPYILLSLFIIIWTNDTGAYCVGSLIGKHKLMPRVSPGKTIEGLVGGLVFALAAGYVVLSSPIHFSGLNFSLIESLIIATVIVVFGTLGDLIESLLKRELGIKDSGNAIPGHGGWLDRFDSLLLSVPAVIITLLLLA